MKLKLSRADLWNAVIEDRAGAVADKFDPLVQAGANFEFVFGRRTPEDPGKGTLFVFPVKGAKVTRAAREAGFAKPDNVHSVRIEGRNRAGAGAKIAHALADAGISFRALSATVLGTKFVCYFALDTADDALKAISVLKKLT